MSSKALTYLALSRVKEFNIAALKIALEKRGTIENLHKLPFDELVGMGIHMKTASAMQDADMKFAESEQKGLEKLNGRLLTYEDDDYPQLLKETYDPPLSLYTMGNVQPLNSVCVALVGARKVSSQGEDMSTILARELSKCGVTIVSGLAYGVDIRAHAATVKNGGATVAVLGSGFNNIYPKQHAKYIDAICRDGCVISEYPMDEPPNAYNFPKRNRIISGLSKGVVVVEASNRSGSLITARLALEQGRDVFAVPVSPLSANNATNTLIQNGAILVQSHADIVSEYYFLLKDFIDTETEVAKEKQFETESQKAVWEKISLNPMSVDELVNLTAIPYEQLITDITMMELDGHIKRGTDSRYYPVAE